MVDPELHARVRRNDRKVDKYQAAMSEGVTFPPVVRVVEMLLGAPDWSQWSDGQIARACHVSDKTVAKYRRGRQPATAAHPGNSGVSQRRYITKHGSAAVMRLPAAPAAPQSKPALFLGGALPLRTARPGALNAVEAVGQRDGGKADPPGSHPAALGKGSLTGTERSLDALLRLAAELRGLGPDGLRREVDISRLHQAADEIRPLLELLDSARA